MQKLRLATPVGVLTNLFTSIGGFALIATLIWHWIDATEKSIQTLNDKSDAHYKSIYQKIDSVSKQEAIDISQEAQTEKQDVISLTAKVYGCCGGKG